MKEFYHTYEEYARQGLKPFKQHIDDYLSGERTVPVAKTNDIPPGQQISFTFSNRLMKEMREGNKLDKPYEVAIKYGFRNYSQGGKNGIFRLRDSDAGLWEAYHQYLEKDLDEIVEDLTSDAVADGLDPVKIVWHNDEDRRVVGTFSGSNKRAYFMDTATY